MKVDRGLVAAACVALVSAAGVAAVQPTLADGVAKISDTSDVYPLPPEEQLPLFTLGYDAAGADVLWAHTLVVQGLRMQKRRHFDHGARYFESILRLDPTFRDPYLFVDAVLTFGAVRASQDDVRATRRILERGVVARPHDAEIAYQAGSFIAYVAPGYLDTEEEAQRWEADGAGYLAKAAELGSSDPRIQSLSLSGATLLSKRGQRAAAISMLERAFAVASSEEVRTDILNRLRALRSEASVDGARSYVRRFQDTWSDDLPFVSLSTETALGPPVDVLGCVGARSRDRRRCERSWAARLAEP